jgi:hypothetical protein
VWRAQHKKAIPWPKQLEGLVLDVEQLRVELQSTTTTKQQHITRNIKKEDSTEIDDKFKQFALSS